MILKDAITNTENGTEHQEETAREFDRKMSRNLWTIEDSYEDFATAMLALCNRALVIAFIMWVVTFVATPTMLPIAETAINIALCAAAICFLLPLAFALLLDVWLRPAVNKAIKKRYMEEQQS